MNLTVYVPKALETTLREKASQAGVTPALYVQRIIKDKLTSDEPRFSDRFAALSGSWEDERSVEEIMANIEQARTTAEPPEFA